MSHIQSGLQFPKNVNGRQFAIHDFGKRDLCVCAPLDPTTTKNAPQTPLHDGSNPGARTKLPTHTKAASETT